MKQNAKKRTGRHDCACCGAFANMQSREVTIDAKRLAHVRAVRDSVLCFPLTLRLHNLNPFDANLYVSSL